MSPAIPFVACAVGSYLLGAIPFGLLVARAKGIDVRKVGSGNIGATNVFRAISKPLGVLTFILDALKGLIPALAIPLLVQRFIPSFPADRLDLLGLVCGCLAVAGHNWPVYLGFKGGKGVATSAGALLGFAPKAVGLGLLAWVIVLMATRYVSVASIAAAAVIAVAGWLLYLHTGLLLPIALTLLGTATIWRHKANIQRLMNGTENRFGKKKPATTGSDTPA